MFENLNDDNYMLFAAKYYENAHCTDLLEFHDDLKRIRYIKRLFKKYEQTGELKDRLIFNHLIVLYNVFEGEAMTKMLVFKLQNYLEYLKPFLMLIARWPEYIEGVFEEILIGTDISMDMNLVDRLRKI